MNAFIKFRNWGDAHHPKMLDIIRMQVAAILLLPIVFGAIFFVNILNPFFNAELWLSILVMALLILFIVIGSGPLSLDRFLSNYKQPEEKELTGKDLH